MPPPKNPKTPPCCKCRGKCASNKCPCVRAYRKCTVHCRRKQSCGNPPDTPLPQTQNGAPPTRPEPVAKNLGTATVTKPSGTPRARDLSSRSQEHGVAANGSGARALPRVSAPATPTVDKAPILQPSTTPRRAEVTAPAVSRQFVAASHSPAVQIHPVRANGSSTPPLQPRALPATIRPTQAPQIPQRAVNPPRATPNVHTRMRRPVPIRPRPKNIASAPTPHGRSVSNPSVCDPQPIAVRIGPLRGGIRKSPPKVIRAPPTVVNPRHKRFTIPQEGPRSLPRPAIASSSVKVVRQTVEAMVDKAENKGLTLRSRRSNSSAWKRWNDFCNVKEINPLSWIQSGDYFPQFETLEEERRVMAEFAAFLIRFPYTGTRGTTNYARNMMSKVATQYQVMTGRRPGSTIVEQHDVWTARILKGLAFEAKKPNAPRRPITQAELLQFKRSLNLITDATHRVL